VLDNVEDLVSGDDGQGVLLDRNEQGWWTDLSPTGAAFREWRSEARTESGNREEKTDRREARETPQKFGPCPDRRESHMTWRRPRHREALFGRNEQG